MSSDSRLVRRARRDVVTTVAIAGAAFGIGCGHRPAARADTRPSPVTHLLAPGRPPPASAVADPGLLRVCADPNNLPFTNRKGEGFENAIAELVARDLGRRLEYCWQPQRRGFIRTTLKAGLCDVVMGVPAQFDMALPTKP